MKQESIKATTGNIPSIHTQSLSANPRHRLPNSHLSLSPTLRTSSRMSRPIKAAAQQPSDPQRVAFFDRSSLTYEQTASIMIQMAKHLLTLTPPLDSSSVIHDNASGPGTVTAEILSLPQFARAPPPKIYPTDFSPGMIRALNTRAKREKWPSNAIFPQVMDAMDLGHFPSNFFTHSYLAAAIFIIPDPIRAISEIKRTLRPGGYALVTSFEKQGFISIFQNVQKAVRPDAPEWKGPMPQEWLTEQKLRDVMVGGGFSPAKLQIERHNVWMGGDDWLKPAMEIGLNLFITSITNGWSEEDKAKFEKRLRSELRSDRVQNSSTEMKMFIAVARK